MMKRQLMRAIESTPVIGGVYRAIERRLFFRHIKRLRREAGLRFAEANGNTVKYGVFAGMKVLSEDTWGVNQFTVLSGQYESELYPIMSDAATKSYDAFIDIGCAEGFYAVGFATISNNCHVIAYDISEAARRVTRLNATLNAVSDRITIKSEANHTELQKTIDRYAKVFVLSDIEGAEIGLIDPEKCPALRKCDLLIEVHGCTDEVAAVLVKRFAGSHKAHIIARSPRNPFLFEEISCTFEDEAWVTVSEGRRFIRNNWVLLESI
jgi:hypothetical protein